MIRIDKGKLYESHSYKFKNFICLLEEEKRMVLDWRNSLEIRKWMINRNEINYENHCKFIDSLSLREDIFYWLVYTPDNTPIGVFDIKIIDRDANIAECGDYAKPRKFDDGFYFLRECLFFYFNVLEIENNYTEADINNKNIHVLNTFFGIIYNGRKAIEKDGEKHEYLTCDKFTRDMFNRKYKLTFKDYITYFRQYKDK